jgi:hypothetical protein
MIPTYIVKHNRSCALHVLIEGAAAALPGGLMRKPNYQELKKHREAAKKRAKQEKLTKRHGGATPPDTTPKEPT